MSQRVTRAHSGLGVESLKRAAFAGGGLRRWSHHIIISVPCKTLMAACSTAFVLSLWASVLFALCLLTCQAALAVAATIAAQELTGSIHPAGRRPEVAFPRAFAFCRRCCQCSHLLGGRGLTPDLTVFREVTAFDARLSHAHGHPLHACASAKSEGCATCS